MATRRRGPSVREAVAAGGVVLRRGDRGAEVVLAGRDGMWVLPKGTPDVGERIEDCAAREVREETGLDVRIVRPIGQIEYSFSPARGGTPARGPAKRVHKTVHFFLMEALGGDTSRHDHEYDDVRWVPVDDARRMLTFETYREMLERAIDMEAAA